MRMSVNRLDVDISKMLSAGSANCRHGVWYLSVAGMSTDSSSHEAIWLRERLGYCFYLSQLRVFLVLTFPDSVQQEARIVEVDRPQIFSLSS